MPKTGLGSQIISLSLNICLLTRQRTNMFLQFCQRKETGFPSVQFSQSCLTLCDAMNSSTPASLSITNSWSLPKPSHPYMTTGKTIALTRWTFIGKVMSLLFNILSQFSSFTQLFPTLCDPMNCSTSGLPVHHQLPEFAQTHAHRVGDAIQPSHPLSSPSPPAPNPSQHQGLFQ